MEKAEKVLKSTQSRCPLCRNLVPSKVVVAPISNEDSDRVYLRKSCPDHGISESLISSDARFYWLSRGSGSSSGTVCCEPQSSQAQAASGTGRGTLGRNALLNLQPRDPEPFDKLSTCLALIEIVDSCNLACPTCYADSPSGMGENVQATPLKKIQSLVQGIIDRKGPIEILQLSGGEPTLHPEFFEVLDWCLEHDGIDYVLVNTNGIRIARELDFTGKLARRAQYGSLQLYLQYDGPGQGGQRELRGTDLRKVKINAIERAGDLGIPLTLAMTVIAENIGQLWAAVEFGLRYPCIRGVSFQPMFGSGRTPDGVASPRSINTADIILGLVEQSDELLKFDDFTPLPCGDPNCATIGYLLKADGEIRSISEFVDFQSLQGFLRDRIRYQLEDLQQCGCESEPLGELLHKLEMDESDAFRLFIKPFMDADSWDQDRIDRCCTHVIRPDGALDSFCRYYFHGGAAAYR